MSTPQRRSPRDVGAATLELAILAPVMLLLIGFVVVAGRVAVANAAVTSIAGNAARDASIARSPTAAAATASTTARQALAAQALKCGDGGTVAVDTTGFGAPAGALVTVTVTCTVSFADLAMPGLPGSRTLTETAVSPVDVNRDIRAEGS